MGQVRKTSVCNPVSGDSSPYQIIYEYDVVEVQPQFPGGERGMINYINRTREYPYSAYVRKIEGRVLCSFIIDAEGNVTHVRVIKGVEATLNKEAVRIIKLMPQWKAGQMDGERVSVHCILPIAFRL